MTAPACGAASRAHVTNVAPARRRHAAAPLCARRRRRRRPDRGRICRLQGALETTSPRPPAPRVAAAGEQERAVAAEQLGFPGFATKNTTRIGGGDSAAVAAGAALRPSRRRAGSRAPRRAWSARRTGPPASRPRCSWRRRSAPVLVSGADEVPELTSTAIVALGPQGSFETDDAQAFAIGDVATPDDLRVTDVEGANPAEVAAAIEELRAELTGIKPATSCSRPPTRPHTRCRPPPGPRARGTRSCS